MSYRLLTLNPGSTSTKIAVYEDERELWRENIEHSNEDLARYETIDEQTKFRLDEISAALNRAGENLGSLAAVVGRGGLLPPVKAGGYLVNEAMKKRLKASQVGFHASNLGALLAAALAEPLAKPAYIYDAVSSDEMFDVARLTGIPEISRQSFCHVLNSKAMARKVAAKLGGRYEDMNFLVAHLGGGISISVHNRGRIVDSLADDAGPFSPERAGSLPVRYIVQLCYSGQYTEKEMLYKLRGKGGLKAHLGVHDCREIEKMIANGDQKAKLLYEAQAYQIAKGLGLLAPVLGGHFDAVILTGGLAYSQMLTSMVAELVKFIAPVEVMPGENELESLALGALRILRGQEQAHEYIDSEFK